MIQVDKGVRVGNFIIDMIVLVVIIVIAASLLSFVLPEIVDSNSAAFDVLASTMFFLYYFLFELFLGKTIGKMLTKTIVVDKNGNKPKMLNLIARSAVRLIPIEGISFLFGPTGLHDLMSGTRVTKIKEAATNKIIVESA